jgi:hypothetical protein
MVYIGFYRRDSVQILQSHILCDIKCHMISSPARHFIAFNSFIYLSQPTPTLMPFHPSIHKLRPMMQPKPSPLEAKPE